MTRTGSFTSLLVVIQQCNLQVTLPSTSVYRYDDHILLAGVGCINLEQCAFLGFRALAFQPFAWLKLYIEFDTNMRKQAKTEFEKDFFKATKGN